MQDRNNFCLLVCMYVCACLAEVYMAQSWVRSLERQIHRRKSLPCRDDGNQLGENLPVLRNSLVAVCKIGTTIFVRFLKSSTAMSSTSWSYCHGPTEISSPGRNMDSCSHLQKSRTSWVEGVKGFSIGQSLANNDDNNNNNGYLEHPNPHRPWVLTQF